MIFSCNGKYEGNSEGEIHYKVTYPKLEKDNFMRDFMPKKMVLKFKDDKYITHLSAGMGMFKTNFLCDFENQEFLQMVKLINKKYVLKLKDEEIKNSLNNMPLFLVEFTNETKKILGYECKKAIVTINNGMNDAFTVFYTDEINIESPNWSNQFSVINGVLLEYQYEKYDVCMKFTAKKIHYKTIEDSEFDVPNTYKEITEKQMDQEMKEIFESFN